ncbi:GATOR complex protein Iml1 isoform X2 [Patella vulgata]|uniref:GATOR complex protein Iml1 isoform X2 n=1 Tax=Patella vulgata TaxID=6465 RepID=UPI00217FD817|nr:GATOR complex protein Iml1 isoform X2 [Patella vulgata]
MKTYKLSLHSKTQKDADILLNPKEFPDINLGDVVEIYDQAEAYSRLLLQVKQVKDVKDECPQQKEAISIEQSIAAAFHLKNKDVYVSKVNPKDVSLDLVELLFKEQYFSRSDMYRMWKSLIGGCVYLNKKVEYTEMRAEVVELWSKGEKVTCGVISDTTRVVYRSSTAVVQIFIQMSSEMWDFDISGDLYFEKAVNGFLTDLFLKWKEQNCCHDVTIVLFSRTFYDVHSIEEFPEHIRDCLQIDCKGRIYEDFYRVVVQNERYMYEEWSNTLRDLRILFNKYPDRVLHYHRKNRKHIPMGYNSTAAQGNFLETLNMSLNLFETHYMDRNFDRTGKVSVVITPGPGVFEVDRELTNITKQRTIDCGVGSDLVCMGEQPLHAAPLFKFHSKDAQTTFEIGDDYNIPHWMNHSFYISKNQIENFKNMSFIPRIKPPQEYLDLLAEKPKLKACRTPSNFEDDDDSFPFMEYDEYDAQVFKLPSRNNPRPLDEIEEVQGKSSSFYHNNRRKLQDKSQSDVHASRRTRSRYRSDDFEGIYASGRAMNNTKVASSTQAICIPPGSISDDLASSVGGLNPIMERGASRVSTESSENEEIQYNRLVVGSAGSPVGHSRKSLANYRPRRALINPFAPSRMQFKMTANMRRWVHAFPKDPKGTPVQPNIMRSYGYLEEEEENSWTTPTKEVLQGAQRAVEARRQRSISRQGSIDHDLTSCQNSTDSLNGLNVSPNHSQHTTSSNDGLSSSLSNSTITNPEHGRYKGGSKAREKLFVDSRPIGVDPGWYPYMTTGWDWRPLDKNEERMSVSRLVKPILTADIQSQNFSSGISVDWKSLTTPASLPITTDFFPDSHSLHYDYVVSDYNLLPDDINSDYWIKPASTEDEKFYRQEPITTVQVFRELINQRLAEGFQLILFNNPKIITQKEANMGTSPQYQHASSLIRARPRQENQEEYYLSIGRIFHKLTLCGPTITVTRYRPRHSQPKHHYKYLYRFQCPDSNSYDVSWTEFSNEQLENYNWNYLDQYICTRGEGDYDLMESLKFWRSRFFLLPCNNSATKKIIEGSSRCDIYEDKTLAELKQLISGFQRFLEVANKIKRPQQTRKSRVNLPPEGVNLTPDSSPNKPETDKQIHKEEITCSTPSVKIIETMMDPQNGLCFLPKQPGIQENCFISAECVTWCIQNIHGVKTVPEASQLMQKLLDDQLIIHASGNPKHRFIYGFYIYMVVTPTSKQKTQDLNLGTGQPYNMFFQNEFCEVSIKHCQEEEEIQEMKKFYLRDEELAPFDDESDDWRVLSGLNCRDKGQQLGKVNLCEVKATKHNKFVNVDVDINKKSERLEWATARYHAYYRPNTAFELQVQWMVATGCLLGELVYSWTRKAVSSGFHFLPVPVDPFALPNSPNSDPLRGPKFVPLKMDTIFNDDFEIQDLSENARQEQLLHFQQIIIKKFGFLPAGVYSAGVISDDTNTEVNQYVHCTGGMFIIIPDYKLLSPKSVETHYTSSFSKRSSSDLCKDYIARQQEPEESHTETGFLWSWNFMLSKRWRSSNTGDEHFQNKVLADFRKFVSNSDGRLLELWNEYKTKDL